MLTPARNNCCKTSPSSTQVAPSSGKQSNVEPPPETIIITRSFSWRLSNMATMALVAAMFFSVGRGWVPSITFTVFKFCAGEPSTPKTMPSKSLAPKISSKAAAASMAHLPTPTKKIRFAPTSEQIWSLTHKRLSSSLIAALMTVPVSTAMRPASAISKTARRAWVVASFFALSIFMSLLYHNKQDSEIEAMLS